MRSDHRLIDHSLDGNNNTPSSSPHTIRRNGRGKNNSSNSSSSSNSSNKLGRRIFIKYNKYKYMQNLVAAAVCMMVVRSILSNISVSNFPAETHPLVRLDAAGKLQREGLPPKSIDLIQQSRRTSPRPPFRMGSNPPLKVRRISGGNYSNSDTGNIQNNKVPADGTMLVQPDDYIYKRDLSRYDAAPIVVPEYRLLFFSVPKVACTTFKFLFRRIKGIEEWDSQDPRQVLPHNPEFNGLRYVWELWWPGHPFLVCFFVAVVVGRIVGHRWALHLAG
jgi:hypothetical protein